jgi:hypothetical protein
MASSLADDAEGPQDDLGREQQTTHGEPAGQPSDLVAIEVDVALNPSARLQHLREGLCGVDDVRRMGAINGSASARLCTAEMVGPASEVWNSVIAVGASTVGKLVEVELERIEPQR